MNEKKLEELESKIYGAADKALTELQFTLMAVHESVLNDGQKPKGKIRKASLEEIEKLLQFYLDCFFASSDKSEKYRKKKLKQLSNLELDTIVVEDYMNKKLRNLLIKYNETIYS